jgi:HEAT repeat protein
MKVEAAVPALIEALHDTSREVRYNAAGALWNLGEAARPRSRS